MESISGAHHAHPTGPSGAAPTPSGSPFFYCMKGLRVGNFTAKLCGPS